MFYIIRLVPNDCVELLDGVQRIDEELRVHLISGEAEDYAARDLMLFVVQRYWIG